jgi:hydroxymethylglutaryl-CoA reductase
MAGATGDEVEKVVEIMVRDGKIRLDYAKEVLEKIRGEMG